ncbi:Sister chromatid cohesion protein pds5 [Elasticomyces elasticus]|nr:Sister chromatid cohesion protein pds5 [Elasticomyces elasticus]
MPAARTRARSPEEVLASDDKDAHVGLRFKEAITWRAGKPIAVSDLLRRLKTLFDELLSIGQEDTNRDALRSIAGDLVHANLLSHKDHGVKAWVACCIVEVFRICAPDAPFQPSQLKSIFTLVAVGIVPSLANPSDPYINQHMHVLSSLTTIKSIVLMTDIPESNALILHLFTSCFDVLSGSSRANTGEELSKNVEFHMTGMLVTLVEEAGNLPTGVVDILLAQFLRADPTSFSAQTAQGKKGGKVDERQPILVVKQLPAAYNMAKNICNSCSDKMSRAIGSYFSSVIIGASDARGSDDARKHKRRRTSDAADDSDDERASSPSEDDIKQLHRVHRLLRELWRSASDVLPNIIPQLEAEVLADTIELRTIATETLGDLIAGIGAAGPPPSATLNPAAYPSQSVDEQSARDLVDNLLTRPAAPHAFSSVYPTAYASFLQRRNDMSAVVRSACVTGIGYIIMTSAGGVGLDSDDETQLLSYLAASLVDQDERVRMAAVQIIGRFSFVDVLQKLGAAGSVGTPGSVLSNLADRMKDKKHSIRTRAMELLASIWGVATGAIGEGSERTSETLGAIPSRIFETVYVNDRDINALVCRVLFESLVPLQYPPLKPKASSTSNGNSQHVKDSESGGVPDEATPDPDALRAERILLLLRDLDTKAKTVFFALQGRQVQNAKLMEALLKKCEEYNGGVMDQNKKTIVAHITKLIDHHASSMPDSGKASEDLWKFAKMHDRRSYQLIRFCISQESDYRKVMKAIREMTKRVEEAPGSMATALDTILPLVYSASVLIYNKSHVPTIMDISRTDKNGLGAAAHEILKEISAKNPRVFKAHVQALCSALELQAPSQDNDNEQSAVDTLKACAGFARQFPKEMPQERKFFQAMIQYAIHGSPPKAAKHAVSVIIWSAEKKDLYAKRICEQCVKGFTYGSGNYLSKLAAFSQLMLLAPQELEDYSDSVLNIAIKEVLLQNRRPAEDEDPEWLEEEDEDCQAKVWALNILANRLRGHANAGGSSHVAGSETTNMVCRLLNNLVEKEGEISKTDTTPKHHRARLRLTAATLLLKLSCNKQMDALLTPQNFQRLATVAQDLTPQVRIRFVDAVKKYLGEGVLPRRFYAVVFLLAYEGRDKIREGTITWLRVRTAAFAKAKDVTMEAALAHFLSLLAHHPEFPTQTDQYHELVGYIVFYLKSVATEANLPLIYHIAQRVKSVQDAIDPAMSDHLYILSDLTQAVIRRYEELQGWSMQAYSGKATLPKGLFAALPGHTVAQEIAEKQYLPQEVMEGLDDWVKESMRSRKRKLDGENGPSKKRSKTHPQRSPMKGTKPIKAAKSVRTPKKKVDRLQDTASAIPSSDRRRSTRTSAQKSYAEKDDSEDDAEMQDWEQGAAAAAEEEHLEETEEEEADPAAQSEGSAAVLEEEENKEDSLPPEPSTTTNTRSGRGKAARANVKTAPKTTSGAPKTTVTAKSKSTGKNGAVTKASGKAKKTKTKTKTKTKDDVFEISNDSGSGLSDPPESDDEA